MSVENTVRYSAAEIRAKIAKGEGRTDLARLRSTTDAEIDVQIQTDADLSDLGEVDWSTAVIAYPMPKNAVSIRLDSDLLDFFKSTGKGYQTRINSILRHYMVETRKSGKLP